MKKIRILLVDDHKILRDGIRSLLKEYSDLEVVGEAADGRTALNLVKELSPDVVVPSGNMPYPSSGSREHNSVWIRDFVNAAIAESPLLQ